MIASSSPSTTQGEPKTLGQRLRKWRRKRVKKNGKLLIRALSDFLAGQSKVGDPAVFETEVFPALAELERNWQTVRREIEPVLERMEALPPLKDISPDQKRIATDDRWRSFVIYGFGMRSERNAALMPETARLIEKVPNLETAWFSILQPGYRVPEHCGITKGIVTSLLGVKVPRKREMCAIRIGEDVHHYEDGRMIVFDDTLPHEIWNETEDDRVVLIVDFRRPMRPVGRIFNDFFLWVFKRTGYVTEARTLFEEWEDRFHEKPAA